MSVRPRSGVSLAGSPGVRRAARVHGLGRNRRDPSAWPASGKDRSYKPMVKSTGGQRESEGVVVPVIGVQHNAPGGKGPHFDHAGGEGKREGMAGTTRSNHPGGLTSPDCRGGNLRGKCDNFNAGYGLRPSSLRSGVSMPCMTVFIGMTSCRRRGGGSGANRVRPGWIASPWRMWRRAFARRGLKPTPVPVRVQVPAPAVPQGRADRPSCIPWFNLRNAASLAFAIPVAGADLAKISGGLAVRPRGR